MGSHEDRAYLAPYEDAYASLMALKELFGPSVGGFELRSVGRMYGVVAKPADERSYLMTNHSVETSINTGTLTPNTSLV